MSNDPTQQFPAPQGDPIQSHQSYYGTPPTPPTSPAPKKKMSRGKKWGIGIGAFLAIGLVGSLTNGDKPATDTITTVADNLQSSSSPATSDAGNFPTTDPSVQASLDKAAADKAGADAKAAADAQAKKAKADAAAAKADADAKAAAEKAKTDKGTYDKITARQFAKVAKNPDRYIGKKYVLYGHVTQFDAATGTTTFRADLASSRKSEWYDYDTNSIVDEGRAGIFDDVVQDDLVTIYVEVDGSFSYDTQVGGNTTVPRFVANIVKVTGSTS
ncbi:hypothetical protein [Terrabacter sp. Root181]|uniref:hypothetical protein n=1 Tax=Terrabacter sp. Root181 TaxID=1736484 RepID=UPI00191118A3|nr:hypothetical protein [Terrabacter sp. Root181]